MIICVTGPAGVGKDTAAEYLARQFHAPHVSGGDMLRGMLRVAGLEPKKSAIGDFRTFVRDHYGADAILRMAIAKADSAGGIVSSRL